MKYKLSLLEDYDDEAEEDDAEYDSLHTIAQLKSRSSWLAKIAQKVYDEWDESDKDTYAGGGICHIIADAIASYLNFHGIDTATVSSSHEQHVYCVSRVKEGIYTVDIHWSYYETGGGFSWKKIPNVVFDGKELEFYRLSTDWHDWEQYIGEF